jgi:hypothetical protein
VDGRSGTVGLRRIASLPRRARRHAQANARWRADTQASRHSTGVPLRSDCAYSTPGLTSTEILLVNGTHCRVEGKAEDVEHQILDAARGSVLELAWFTETESGQRIALNPDHVVLLRAVSS